MILICELVLFEALNWLYTAGEFGAFCLLNHTTAIKVTLSLRGYTSALIQTVKGREREYWSLLLITLSVLALPLFPCLSFVCYCLHCTCYGALLLTLISSLSSEPTCRGACYPSESRLKRPAHVLRFPSKISTQLKPDIIRCKLFSAMLKCHLNAKW